MGEVRRASRITQKFDVDLGDDTDDSQPFLHLPVGDLAFSADIERHALDIISSAGEVVYPVVGATGVLILEAIDLCLLAEEDRISLS